MKSTLIIEVGIIGEDGQLRVPQERLREFYRQHPGEKAIVKIEALERHASSSVFRYYFGYIVPTIRQRFAKLGRLLTEKQTHELLWMEYPGEHNTDQDIREAPSSQVYGFIEWLKQYGAENLEIYIEDPKLI